MIKSLRKAIQSFPDRRAGKNLTYSIEDAGLGAFSVFFTQSPSFLAYQRTMEDKKGKSNAHTLFGIKKIPTDNHIRDLLDPVSPELLYPVFDKQIQELERLNYLNEFRSINNNYSYRDGWHKALFIKKDSL
jgi:hypothetical protein